MANSNTTSTGVIFISNRTPVIDALFKDLFLGDPEIRSTSFGVDIAVAEGHDTNWDNVIERLEELALQLGLSIDAELGDDDFPEAVIEALAKHFKASDKEDLQQMVEQIQFEDEAPLEALDILARCFDDGHGYRGYMIEAAWTCSRLRVLEFGGAGRFAGRHVTVAGSSSDVTRLGDRLEDALSKEQPHEAALVLKRHVDTVLNGIHDEVARKAVAEQLHSLLQAA